VRSAAVRARLGFRCSARHSTGKDRTFLSALIGRNWAAFFEALVSSVCLPTGGAVTRSHASHDGAGSSRCSRARTSTQSASSVARSRGARKARDSLAARR
jgi:hypothetical protein